MNVVYGFVMILMKMFEDEKLMYMLVVFDVGKIIFCYGIFKEYKGGRQKILFEFFE